ncbi:hypothetical protein EVAR_60215_1 [Eumeta japonica]|uniref:Uncharacterized protein n=1 Tax=Eumeta variegata TaxID=151549 RepID=A0A4C1Z614_EUMVA|nr:hypothetical protein EVAR_60215_1 [Eumeta japonica]
MREEGRPRVSTPNRGRIRIFRKTFHSGNDRLITRVIHLTQAVFLYLESHYFKGFQNVSFLTKTPAAGRRRPAYLAPRQRHEAVTLFVILSVNGSRKQSWAACWGRSRIYSRYRRGRRLEAAAPARAHACTYTPDPELRRPIALYGKKNIKKPVTRE